MSIVEILITRLLVKVLPRLNNIPCIVCFLRMSVIICYYQYNKYTFGNTNTSSNNNKTMKSLFDSLKYQNSPTTKCYYFKTFVELQCQL